MNRRRTKDLVKGVLPESALSLARMIASRKAPRFKSMPGGGVLECCIAYTPNGGFCVPLSSRHRPAAQKIFCGDVHEPKTIEFMVSRCGNDDMVHAGTYFGDFLPALSRACRGKVWAFEPNPENYRCAAITCTLNDLQNVELANAGLGSEKGAAAMVTTDDHGKSLGGASRITPNSSANHTEEIQIVALDEVLPADRQVSIIQLDVEGYEQQALTGALKTIVRCLPVLVLETLPGEPWLSDNVLRLGYTTGPDLHPNSVLLPPS